MSKEKFNQIINEAYENYCMSYKDGHEFYEDEKIKRSFTKEEFINKCKTDTEFSENWGLKIKERELSLEERQKLYEDEFTSGIEVQNNHWLNSKLTTRNIPTKLITVTYNNETIESYE